MSALQNRLPTAVFQVRPLGARSKRSGRRSAARSALLMDVDASRTGGETAGAGESVAQAYAIFGGLAVLLASIGLFGLMSYTVARRTHEIGIRMALGAQRYDVLRLVMGESMALVVAGVAIGLAAALAASRLVASLLFGLAPTDALTMLFATTVMVAVSAIAGYLPARRASRVDPMIALHYE